MNNDKAEGIGLGIISVIIAVGIAAIFILIGMRIQMCGQLYKCEDLYIKCAQGSCNETEIIVEKACRTPEEKK